MTIIDDRKAALMARVKEYGGPLNEPAVLAQFLAQVMHESGGLRYVREIWGPTKAQRGYEGRKDLGNTQPGDGKRFMGRDVIQITGRANYRALSKWAGFDFEAKPEALESPEWLGIGAIWYFLTRKGLIDYARAGNIEMVTRRVNGGLNGYADRLRKYDAVALEILGYSDVRSFQKAARLVVDGISGPKTRAMMHECLSHPMTKPATPPKTPAQREVTPTPSQAKKDRISFVQGVVTAASLALAAWVTNATRAIAEGWHDFWVWAFSGFGL